MRFSVKLGNKYWKFFNPRKRFGNVNDHCIRAFAALSGQSWNDTMDSLCEYAKKTQYPPTDEGCWSKWLKDLGYEHIKIVLNKGDRRLTVEQLIDKHKGSDLLVRISRKTLVACVGGKAWDIKDNTKKPIYSYWLKKK